MKRADKIRMAEEAAAKARQEDDRNPEARDAARREWAQVRKAAREAFLAKKDWMSILNNFRDSEGFYTAEERARMCKEYATELISNALK